MATEGFTSKIVGIVIAVIVVAAVAIPVITDVAGAADVDGTTTGTILGILPVFLVLAVLMIVVKMFLNNRE